MKRKPIILCVEKAEHVGGYTLRLSFNNDEVRLFDFSTVYDRNQYTAKLKDPDYFRDFTLDGITVDWHNEIGFAPEFLLEKGSAAPGAATPPFATI